MDGNEAEGTVQQSLQTLAPVAAAALATALLSWWLFAIRL